MMQAHRLLMAFYCYFVLSFFCQSHAEDWTYTVRKGETLWGLCLKYTTVPSCWQKIGPYNNVEYPRNLAPGTRIRFPVSWLKEQPIPVLASFVRGPTYKLTPDGNPVLIKQGDLLTMGTKISVPAGSVIRLTFADDSVMMVESDSELVLDRLSNFGSSGMVDTRINLRRGSVQTRVPKRQPRYHFEVATPSSVAAVRGTDFRVTEVVDKASTRSEVFSGEVLVYNSLAERALPEGMGLITKKGMSIPEPVALLPAPSIHHVAEKQAMPYVFGWDKVQDAERYKVEVIHQQQNTLLHTEITRATELLLQGLPPACHRVRVSGISADLLQGMPAEGEVCLYAPLSAPQGINFSNKTDKAALLSWKEVSGASQYRLELSKSSSFESLALSQLVDSPSAELPPGHSGIFYARVAALDENANLGEISDSIQIDSGSEPEERSGLMFTMFLMVALMIL